jgi:hypothetical protein
VFGERNRNRNSGPVGVLVRRNETETEPELTSHETKRNRNSAKLHYGKSPFRFILEFPVLVLTLPTILIPRSYPAGCLWSRGELSQTVVKVYSLRTAGGGESNLKVKVQIREFARTRNDSLGGARPP